MNRKPFKTYAAILATALGLLGAPAAMAQAPSVPPATTTNFPGDWPNLGAFNNRQGRNGDPVTYNSGLTLERWTSPSTIADTLTILLDDTDIKANFYTNGGPYDVPLDNGGYVQFNDAGGNANYAAWSSPATLDKEAGSPYVPLARVRNVDGTSATTPNLSSRTPAYHFAVCTPSAHGTDPTVPIPAYASDLRTVDYFFTPPATGRNYAIYAYLPIGSTDVSAGTATGTRLFPQRFLVYRIFYSNGASYTDIVDTNLSGNGFVRLGNRGLATTRVFPYTSVGGTAYPIQVRLYNTVPRYDDGSLAIDGSFVNEADSQERSLAQTRLVYADAMEARPTPGSFVASPTAQTVVAGTTLDQFNTATTPYALTQASTVDWRVTVARNDFVTSISSAGLDQANSGTVISYQANPNKWASTAMTTPLEAWRYSPGGDASSSATVDNSSIASPPAAWTTTTVNLYHNGPDYLRASAVFPTGNPAVRPPDANISSLTYAPTLSDGTYAVYAYIPGNIPSVIAEEHYGTQVEYRIYQGSTLVDTVYVDQSRAQGWLQLGNRRYTHISDKGDGTTVAPITVVVTNYDNSVSDSTNPNLKVYADAIRFVGTANRGINSTPVHATVNIAGKGSTKVVIVGDESGKLHCLDLNGNGDGTTTEYWSYPSTSDGTTTYSDPNAPTSGSGPDGHDGVNLAIAPTGFDLSTAAVAHVGSKDLLYIGSTNGRVYCIDMAGRGDFDATSHKIGTTQREWTFPNDYDPSTPTGPIAGSALGAFRGSIVVGDTAQGLAAPTVFIPATQGRVYALDAAGTETTRSTTVKWQYPAATLSPLPAIAMTPTLFKPTNGNARLIFGTQFDSSNDGPGRLYALDATSGDIIWQYNGSTTQNTADVHDKSTTIRRVNAGMTSFITGVLAVPGSALDAVPESVQTTGTVTHVDTVYALNNNQTLYGFDAATGAPITYGTQTYAATDLLTLSDANLSYTVVQAYNRTLSTTTEAFPVIVVPGNNGQLVWAFARAEDYNQFNGYLAGGFTANSDVPFAFTSAAAANNYLFAATGEGKLFALDNFGSGAGNINTDPLFDPGLSPTIPPNDPRGDIYRHLKVKLVNKAAYAALRQANATNPQSGQGTLTFDQAVNDPTWNGPTGNPVAFEWGETAYVLVYNFPYTVSRGTGAQSVAIPPPTISLTLTVGGRSVRQVQVDSRQFVPTSPNVDGAASAAVADGYAVVPFAFQNAGATAIPPGSGKITASLSTAAFGTGTGTTQVSTVTQDTRSGALSEIDFIMANPLAVLVYDTPTDTGTSSGIGNTLNASADVNAVNGSPSLASGNYSQLLASGGYAQHGTTATARIAVIDRSLMVILRPEGLTNVRLQRTNLQRQGAEKGIFSPLSSTIYPGFEDKPDNFPNTSLDYPDIGREQVRAVKDPNGSAENPLLTSVTLKPPLSNNPNDGSAGNVLTESNLWTNAGQANSRSFQQTLFSIPIDVPRYQPPVNVNALSVQAGATDDNTDLLDLHRNANGVSTIPQGYFGRLQVYVDTNGDGQANLGTNPEPYRAANYAVGVVPQTSILTGTPTVDLGSLASGTGYSPLNPAAQDPTNGLFSPWNPAATAWSGAYQPISVRNDSNVNLLHLRLARATNTTGTDANMTDNQPVGLFAADNDPLAWLSAVTRDNAGNLLDGDLWSNFGAKFAATHGSDNANSIFADDVILPKPRVTDRTPTELVANPYPRANPNIRIDPLSGQITTSSTGILVNGTSAYRLNKDPRYQSSAPKVAVSVPIGFPVGSYQSQIQVVENSYSKLTSGLDNEILELFLGNSTGIGVTAPTNQYEAYSDPITLTFKVRESRLTNAPTPRTAPMIDVAGANPISRNTAPAAMRDAFGSLVVAWQSDRAAVGTSTATYNVSNPSRLYFSSLPTQATFTSSGINAPAGNAPLWDLGQFVGGTNSWFTTYTAAAGFPASGNDLGLFLGASAGGNTLVAGTTGYRSPAFPAAGSLDPLSTTSPKASFGTTFVGFVGDTQVSTTTGRLNASRVFVVPVNTSSNGSVSVGNAAGAGGDLQTAKGKPSVLQLSNSGGLVFYAETGAGQSGITVSRFSAAGTANAVTFANPVALDFGGGFSSVFSPSAIARLYKGANVASASNTGGVPAQIVELSFAGKLRGRANAEPFMGRMRLDGTHTGLVDASGNNVETANAGSPFVYLSQQTNERLLGEGNGLYRARGVDWNRADFLNRLQDANNPPLVQYLPGATTGVSLVIPSTATVDRQSGLIACDSRVGGKVYIDPDLGTVRLAGGVLNPNAQIRITYVPAFLRVTNGGAAGYSSVNALFDDRYIGEYAADATTGAIYYPYWFRNATTLAQPTDNLRNDRYVFAYGRGATGGGVTARPYTTTMRLGVRLPGRIYTDSSGGVAGGVQVSGNTKPYQVDPANGRVYFQAEDEDRSVTITYFPANEATNGQGSPLTVTANVSYVLERDETPIPVDEAANESAITAFLDPFTYQSGTTARHERPPLLWLFYTSTRAGGPDLYFQTIAPRYLPSAK